MYVIDKMTKVSIECSEHPYQMLYEMQRMLGDYIASIERGDHALTVRSSTNEAKVLMNPNFELQEDGLVISTGSELIKLDLNDSFKLREYLQSQYKETSVSTESKQLPEKTVLNSPGSEIMAINGARAPLSVLQITMDSIEKGYYVPMGGSKRSRSPPTQSIVRAPYDLPLGSYPSDHLFEPVPPPEYVVQHGHWSVPNPVDPYYERPPVFMPDSQAECSSNSYHRKRKCIDDVEEDQDAALMGSRKKKRKSA